MPSTCVVGLQWGDEAKGKIVDLLCDRHDVVVRYQGGANAGHTVVADGVTYKLSLIPTGILRPGIDCVIGNGVVIHPPALLKEIETLAGAGGRGRGAAPRQRPGPRDPPLSPGRGAADRGVGLGRRPPGHDPAGDRPVLPRQGRPGPRRPGRRPVPPRAVPRAPRPDRRVQEPAPLGDAPRLHPDRRRRRGRRIPRLRRAAPPVRPRHHGLAPRGARPAASGSCSRGRRGRCSTSTTAATRT